MLASYTDASHVVAQSGGGGDSTAIFFIVAAIVTLVAIGLAVLILRARAPDQSRSSRQDANRPVDIGGTAQSGRPVHKDPDPQRLAGGRASFTPPPNE